MELILTTTPKKDVAKNFRNLIVKTLLRDINSDMKEIKFPTAPKSEIVFRPVH